MNKAELVQQMTGRFDGNRKQAAHALESVVNAITFAVAKGEKVAITGFGVFERNERPARMARNPATGAKVRVKKTSVPKFRAGTDFKAYVSGAKKVPRESVAAARTAASAATASKTTARSSASRSTPAKSTSRSTAKSAPAKRSATGKTAAAKSTTAKSTTKTTSARASAKKTPTRSTAKKATTRRTAKS